MDHAKFARTLAVSQMLRNLNGSASVPALCRRYGALKSLRDALMTAPEHAALTILQPPALDHDAMMLRQFQHTVSANGKLERRIVWNLLHVITAAGFELRSVYDGDEVTKVATPKEAMELIFNLDEASVIFCKPGYAKHNVYLVLGNGVDVVCDYSYTEGDADGFGALLEAFEAEVYA